MFGLPFQKYARDAHMRKWLIGCLLILNGFISQHLSAHGEEEGTFELSTGYREDRLRWSIKTPSGNSSSYSSSSSSSSASSGLPHVVSKLHWKGLHSAQVMATARYVNAYNIYFKGIADYGRICEGKERDRDFLVSSSSSSGSSSSSSSLSSSDEFASSKARADRGEVFDLFAGIGYHFRFLCNRATISPLVGYSYHEQRIKMDHLSVDFVNFGSSSDDISGMHSNYRARWKGWWVGFDFTLYMTCNLKLFGGAEYHWVHFHGSGNWDLRRDFVDAFRQRAIGRGEIFSLGINYDFMRDWYVGLQGNYQAWRTTRSGKDKVFLEHRSIDSKLNVVHWHSFCAMGTAGYYF